MGAQSLQFRFQAGDFFLVEVGPMSQRLGARPTCAPGGPVSQIAQRVIDHVLVSLQCRARAWHAFRDGLHRHTPWVDRIAEVSCKFPNGVANPCFERLAA
ncbi:hypothetical protein SAMN05421759_101704 [Roseivivax lentus]|uniref:Uncharacterized protein n=1 Tax=Roseivivax lentus TaxID=633194 RepID=A0A1N7KFL8_9RHOB|nr:hypothetical protein SAMN05421759_101704 [Roseivivax lentus]